MEERERAKRDLHLEAASEDRPSMPCTLHMTICTTLTIINSDTVTGAYLASWIGPLRQVCNSCGDLKQPAIQYNTQATSSNTEVFTPTRGFKVQPADPRSTVHGDHTPTG